jgi:hypothetical protein
VSTLRRYVEALGGELEIVAKAGMDRGRASSDGGPVGRRRAVHGAEMTQQLREELRPDRAPVHGGAHIYFVRGAGAAALPGNPSGQAQAAARRIRAGRCGTRAWPTSAEFGPPAAAARAVTARPTSSGRSRMV